MYNQTLYNGLINVVPFWSNNFIQYIGIGNEYNIVFNMIFSELLKISTNVFSDIVLIGITCIVFAIIIGYKFGFTLNFNLFDKNQIILIGSENNSTEITLNYCNKILALNHYLINVKSIKNITYINDVNIIVNDVTNFNLSIDIYLNISRKIYKMAGVYFIHYGLIKKILMNLLMN